MTDLAWPIVALVAIGSGLWVVRRILDGAARNALPRIEALELHMAELDRVDAASAAEIEDRLGRLELTVGIRPTGS